jgi:diguanylate cyclase (GGDEF)-like protein
MSDTAIAVPATDRTQFGKLVGLGLWLAVLLHALILIAIRPAPIAASRYCTAVVPVLAAIACIWRAVRLPARERPVWLWCSAGMLLWAIAHIFETVFGQSGAASVLTVDRADFIYLAGTFPLLIALSTTRETESLRAVFGLNVAQVVLALILSYALLYRMSLSPSAASTVMGRIYGAACLLLALMSVLRVFTWASPEERNSVRCLGLVLWTYLPVEIAMDYASARWNLQGGTLLDLAWSGPFLIGGLQALHLPLVRGDEPARGAPSRARLLVEALCPMLITAGIFGLAASITSQHPVLGLSAIFVLLAIQGFQAAVVQLNYLAGRDTLLEREHELEETNAALRQMSLEDPLTQIANRRHFETSLQLAWRRGARKGQPLALLMIDIDFFKGVNDHHGHSYGDECLVSIARVLREHARRPDDVVARIGGEEFVMLLPDTEKTGAEAVAMRIQQAIQLLGMANQASPFNRKLTISIGVGAVTQPAYGVDPAILVDCADQALYDAKHQGRNRTCARELD